MPPSALALRTVEVTRYVTPLREGGSLPALAEADDEFLYVLKFRGAGQGVKALIAELIVGEVARVLGLRVPELVFCELDVAFGRSEPVNPVIQAPAQAVQHCLHVQLVHTIRREVDAESGKHLRAGVGLPITVAVPAEEYVRRCSNVEPAIRPEDARRPRQVIHEHG